MALGRPPASRTPPASQTPRNDDAAAAIAGRSDEALRRLSEDGDWGESGGGGEVVARSGGRAQGADEEEAGASKEPVERYFSVSNYLAVAAIVLVRTRLAWRSYGGRLIEIPVMDDSDLFGHVGFDPSLI